MDKIIKDFTAIKNTIFLDRDDDIERILFIKLPVEASLGNGKITDFIKEKYGDELYVHFYFDKILVRTEDMKYRDAICFDIRDFYEHIGTSVEEVEEERRRGAERRMKEKFDFWLELKNREEEERRRKEEERRREEEKFDYDLWYELQNSFLKKFEYYKSIFSEKKIIKSTACEENEFNKSLIIEEIEKEDEIITKIMTDFIKTNINPSLIELKMVDKEIKKYFDFAFEELDSCEVKADHESDYDLLSTFLDKFFDEISESEDNIFIKKLKFPK